MFKDIENFFQGVSSLEQCLSSTDLVNERDLALASCVILVEVASADKAIAPEEGNVVTELIASKFGVNKKDIPILIRQAVNMRKQSGKLGEFVELIANKFNQEQKEAVLYMVWRVILADGQIDTNEEKLVEKLSQYLKLTREHSLEAYQKAIQAEQEKK